MWARSLFGSIALSVYVIYYKNIYDEDDSSLRVWEDLYGRSLFFFVCSVVWYLIHARKNQDISFFELEPEIRWMFALRIVSISFTYCFLALAISEGKGIAVSIVILFLS